MYLLSWFPFKDSISGTPPPTHTKVLKLMKDISFVMLELKKKKKKQKTKQNKTKRFICYPGLDQDQ